MEIGKLLAIRMLLTAKIFTLAVLLGLSALKFAISIFFGVGYWVHITFQNILLDFLWSDDFVFLLFSDSWGSWVQELAGGVELEGESILPKDVHIVVPRHLLALFMLTTHSSNLEIAEFTRYRLHLNNNFLCLLHFSFGLS